VVSVKAPRGSLFLVKVKGRKLNKKQQIVYFIKLLTVVENCDRIK
jgi:hypothetical protein